MAEVHAPNLCCLFKRSLVSIAPISMRKNIMGLAVRENLRVCGTGKGDRLGALVAEKQARIVIGKWEC